MPMPPTKRLSKEWESFADESFKFKQSTRYGNIHHKKNFSIFPSPAGMSLTKLSMGENNDVIYELFPPRESLVSDITVRDGNIENQRCMHWTFT
jgi:hypothetical protein